MSGTLATGNDQTLICMADAAANAAADVDACGSLKANNDRNAPIIAFAIDRATTPKVSEEVCHTLRRGGGGDSNDVVAIAANQRGEVRLQGGDGSVTGAIPASQSGKQINAICQYGEVAGALTARGDSSPCADRGPSVVTEGSYVRRLTPRECERLQGFPDDWTRIPWKGKPAEECPDGPRYKAIGNSMAVPVMRWIGERIAEVSSW